MVVHSWDFYFFFCFFSFFPLHYYSHFYYSFPLRNKPSSTANVIDHLRDIQPPPSAPSAGPRPLPTRQAKTSSGICPTPLLTLRLLTPSVQDFHEAKPDHFAAKPDRPPTGIPSTTVTTSARFPARQTFVPDLATRDGWTRRAEVSPDRLQVWGWSLYGLWRGFGLCMH